jgi:hypothetical protein
MRKSELIEVLNKVEGDPEVYAVAVAHHYLILAYDSEDGRGHHLCGFDFSTPGALQAAVEFN